MDSNRSSSTGWRSTSNCESQKKRKWKRFSFLRENFSHYGKIVDEHESTRRGINYPLVSSIVNDDRSASDNANGNSWQSQSFIAFNLPHFLLRDTLLRICYITESYCIALLFRQTLLKFLFFHSHFGFPPFMFVLLHFLLECMLMTKLIRPCLRPIFRKCFHTAYYFLDYPPRNVPTLQEWENSEQDGERTAVAIQKFVQHVASLHADGDIGFSKEYEFIQSESGKFTAENSQYVENKAKNRYLNILACEYSTMCIPLISRSTRSFRGKIFISIEERLVSTAPRSSCFSSCSSPTSNFYF